MKLMPFFLLSFPSLTPLISLMNVDAQQPPTMCALNARSLNFSPSHTHLVNEKKRKAARRTQNFHTWIKINCISRQWTLASVTLLTILTHRRIAETWRRTRKLIKVEKNIITQIFSSGYFFVLFASFKLKFGHWWKARFFLFLFSTNPCVVWFVCIIVGQR